MTHTMRTILVSATCWFVGCAQTDKSVRPDQMSAQAHRQDAQHGRAMAGREQREANTPPPPPNLAVTPGSNPEGYYLDRSVYDARNEHLARAQQLSKHAQQHEAAAAYLEKFENAECKQVPPATRSACPLLGPVTSIVNIAGGVEVRFADGTRREAVLAHMRCHLAFAAARGFEKQPSCPLYTKGVDIRAGQDATTIDIVGADKKIANEIQVRSQEEAVLVSGVQ